MQFQLCDNTDFFLRLALLGPSGSGKTFTALRLATELGFGKVGIIDTENRSARRYAKEFTQRFETLELSKFSPADFIEAIYAAERVGIQVLVIDSLSHAWMGKGGVLEMVDQSAKRQARGAASSSFNGWREVTPEHNRLVNVLIQAKLHLIVTMRVKTEYVVEKDDRGKSVPRKVGMAPVQRDGLEYEFDIIGEISPEHTLIITKSRCSALADALVDRPGKDMADKLRAWLNGADPRPTDPEPAEADHQDAPAVPPPRMPAEQEELAQIAPWLRKIQESETEEQLDEVRTEMNKLLKRRTKLQGESLRNAIDNVRTAILARTEQQHPLGRWHRLIAEAQTLDALDDLAIRAEVAEREGHLTAPQAEELRELIHQRRQALEGDRR